MRARLMILALAAAAAPVSCTEDGIETFRPVHGQGIVNGQLEPGFPSTVALGGEFGGTVSAMCTGNLITPRVVLSAAHCGNGIPIEIVQAMGKAYFGADVSAPDDAIGFDDLVIHPDYEELVSEPGGDLGQFDLSVFVLSEEAAVEPTWFRRDAITDGDVGAVLTSVGFGITSATGDDSGLKRSAELILSDYDENFLLNYVADNPGSTNICSGDSGGPQFFFRDGFWVQGAVHSWGDQNCVYSSGSTRVDIAVEWILDQVEAVHASRDVCGINGWYGDGVCHPFCDQPDPDCALDTDTEPADAGPADAGAADGGDPGGEDGGCGCTVTPRGAPLGSALLFALLGSVLLLRRRRAR